MNSASAWTGEIRPEDVVVVITEGGQIQFSHTRLAMFWDRSAWRTLNDKVLEAIDAHDSAQLDRLAEAGQI